MSVSPQEAEHEQLIRLAPKWTRSLFWKFFWALLGLALMPTLLIAAFLVATYNSVFLKVVPPDVLATVSANLVAQAVLIFVFIAILASFTAFILSRNITRPLRTLARAAKQVSEGDLDFRVTVTRGDEIGTLGSFFSDMISRLKEVQERQEVISRSKSEFVSLAAHQLRTPLSALKWSLHMFLKGDLGEATKLQRDTLQRTYNANERMIRLVNELLNVARLEEGRFGYTLEEFSFTEFVKELGERYVLYTEPKKQKLVLDVPDEEILMFGDKDRLALALGNLIENAIDYSPAKSAIEVKVGRKNASFVEFEVKDQGMGIPEADKVRIFGKFARGANVMREETTGTGLGLFITRNVILHHGGDVRFISTEGKGTTFIVTLPTNQALVPKTELPKHASLVGLEGSLRT